MKKFSFIILIFTAFYCSGSSYTFYCIPDFSKKTNETLKQFLIQNQKYNKRKVAVFDGDGTVMGQVPHYLADECLYETAKKYPLKKKHVINRMKKISNVSLPYVQDRVFFFEGDRLEDIRDLGNDCFKRHYKNKIYSPIKKLIGLLKKNGFEIWIVTASPEALYQKFLSRAFDIPITNIIGVKSVIHGGKITNRIVKPVPQDHGKKEAIETFVQEVPLFVAGNSRGDKEMIEFSKGLRMIINPDEHVASDQKESIADYAKKNNWLIEKIKDIPEKGFPSVSSNYYNIRMNKTRD